MALVILHTAVDSHDSARTVPRTRGDRSGIVRQHECIEGPAVAGGSIHGREVGVVQRRAIERRTIDSVRHSVWALDEEENRFMSSVCGCLSSSLLILPPLPSQLWRRRRRWCDDDDDGALLTAMVSKPNQPPLWLSFASSSCSSPLMASSFSRCCQ
ncbi:hypothetical protein MPTK2_4g21880 [Marchantia polymorpha subsp. ruderalis]